MLIQQIAPVAKDGVCLDFRRIGTRRQGRSAIGVNPRNFAGGRIDRDRPLDAEVPRLRGPAAGGARAGIGRHGCVGSGVPDLDRDPHRRDARRDVARDRPRQRDLDHPADNRALHRLGRCQAAILTLRRRAHHRKLCIGKFDAHDPTLPLIPEARSIRAPHRDEPRIGRSRRGGWVTRASCAPRLTTTQCSTPNGKPVLSAQGARLW